MVEHPIIPLGLHQDHTYGLTPSGLILSPILIPGELHVYYTIYDRMVAGGAWVKDKELLLKPLSHFGTTYFLSRRELVIYCLSQQGSINIKNKTYNLGLGDVLYAGIQDVNPLFLPVSGVESLFYFTSCPAHRNTETRIIRRSDIKPKTIGEVENLSHRDIFKMVIYPDIDVCQLQSGLTQLREHQIMNTVPPHTHTRRSEIYFYFGLSEGEYVKHYSGPPNSIDSVKLKNFEAIVVPPGHVHYGKGTTEYAFIWSMGGENLDYDDMDPIPNYPL